MLVLPGRISVYSFLSPFTALIILRNEQSFPNTLGVVLIYYLILNVLLRIVFKGFLYDVAIRSCLLGLIFTIGALISYFGASSSVTFGWYLCLLSFFHYSEFLAISICNPSTLNIGSFILDHSKDYKIAAVASWVEFWIEKWLYPDMKANHIIPIIGLLLCIFGEVLRKTAMITASNSFTHAVVSVKGEKQTLVTTGVYALFRHPSYVGWFYWAVGTQMVLANPLCLLAYTLASWKFFNDRVVIEEAMLLNFFGKDYINYQLKVGTGLPFIKGYRID